MNIVVLRGESLGLRGKKPSMMGSYIEDIATIKRGVRGVRLSSGASGGTRRNAGM
jgi:hypothetical protein